MVQDVKERMYNLKVNPPRKDENRRGGDILQRYKKWYTYTSVIFIIKRMGNIEDILYEARELGIYEKVLNRVNRLLIKNPYSHLNDVYDKALQIEKE